MRKTTKMAVTTGKHLLLPAANRQQKRPTSAHADVGLVKKKVCGCQKFSLNSATTLRHAHGR